MDYVALKSEIQADGAGLGFAPLVTAGSTQKIADLLNEVSASYQIDVETVDSSIVLEAIVLSDWGGLTADQKDNVRMVLSTGTIYVKGTNTRAILSDAFSGTTLANLVALQTRDGSRAESLFGANVVVRHNDVSIALYET